LKRILLYVLVLSGIFFQGLAQKEKVRYYQQVDKRLVHFGFTIGVNTMDFIVFHSNPPQNADSLYANVNHLLPGFNVGIVSSFRVAKYLDMRFLPGLSFGQRDLYYYNYNQGTIYARQKIESAFLEFPLIFKYKAKRINNFRPFVLAGLNYRLDMASRRKYNPDKGKFVRLKQSDLYHEEGFGIDFYLPYFKLTAELKVSTGFRNILVTDPSPEHPEYVTALERLRSQIWILSFHFE